uniref:Uncharacterized protein n=1 Tax=Leersia perrieri TaxID=77586 RepID=A0A0D9XSL4_9ORYZ
MPLKSSAKYIGAALQLLIWFNKTVVLCRTVMLGGFICIRVGITLGINILVRYFMQAVVPYPLATIVFAAVYIVSSSTHLPSESSTMVLPWVFSLLIALFPVTYLPEGHLRAKNFADDDEAEIH